MTRDRIDQRFDFVGLLILLAVALCVYARLHYGIDFSDEAYYIALPYAFALGHQPIVDELATGQFAAILLLPFVEAYLDWVGSNSGIVLFARYLYFATALVSALVVRHVIARLFGIRAGWVCAAFSLGYIPFLLPGLSYNTIASLGLLCGLLLLASCCLPTTRSRRVSVGVVCVAIAGFAYTPVTLAGCAAIAFTLVLRSRVRRDADARKALVIALATGVVVCVAAATLVLSYGDLSDLQRIRALSDAFGVQGGGREKFAQLATEFGKQSKYLALIGMIWLVCFKLAATARNRIVSTTVLLLCGPASFAASWAHVPYREPYSTTPLLIGTLGIAAAILLPRVRRVVSQQEAASITIVVFSSLLAGLVFLWSSSNGMRNGALGLMPACLIALASVSKINPRRADQFRGLDATTALGCSLACFIAFETWTYVYRDAPLNRLDTTVADGAWQGIRTSPEKNAYIESLDRDLKKWRGDARTIMFLDYFPAGYLFSDLQPRTPTIWLFPWNDRQQGNRAIREIYARDLGPFERFPDILVRIRCFPAYNRRIPIEMKADDPLIERLLSRGYVRTETRDCYALFKKAFSRQLEPPSGIGRAQPGAEPRSPLLFPMRRVA